MPIIIARRQNQNSQIAIAIGLIALVFGIIGFGLPNTIAWSQITSFPSGCSTGQFVIIVGSSLTCHYPNVASNGAGGQTTTISSIASFSNPSGNHIYSVGCDVDISAYTSGTINCQVTYTDWNGLSQTQTITSNGALGDVLGGENTILVGGASAIVIKTTGTFVATYNVGCWITRQF